MSDTERRDLNPDQAVYPPFCVLLTTSQQMALQVSSLRLHRSWIRWCHLGNPEAWRAEQDGRPDIFLEASAVKDWLSGLSTQRPLLSVTLSTLANDMEVNAVQLMSDACQEWDGFWFVSALITQADLAKGSMHDGSEYAKGFTVQWPVALNGGRERKSQTANQRLQDLMDCLLIPCSSPGLGIDSCDLKCVLTHPTGTPAVECMDCDTALSSEDEIATFSNDPSNLRKLSGWHSAMVVMTFRDARAFRLQVKRDVIRLVESINADSDCEMIFGAVCFDSSLSHPLSLSLIGKRRASAISSTFS